MVRKKSMFMDISLSDNLESLSSFCNKQSFQFLLLTKDRNEYFFDYNSLDQKFLTYLFYVI